MKKSWIRRSAMTLIEIVVVMFFVTLISGVLAYNIKGSINEGKAFETLETMKQVEQLLDLSLIQNPSFAESIEDHWQELISQHPLVKHPKKLLKDAWGQPFEVSYDEEEGLSIYSAPYEAYLQKNQSSLFKAP